MNTLPFQELHSLDLDSDSGLKHALGILLAGVLEERTPFEERTEDEKQELRLWAREWIALGRLPALRHQPAEQRLLTRAVT